MRKWIAAHRKMATLVIVSALWGAGIALFLSLGHPLDKVLGNAVTWGIYTAVLWYIQARSERKTAAKLAGQGGLLVYIRYPDSLPGSLSGIWNMGVATFGGAAVMTFQPAVYDTLEPSGRAAAFTALAPVSSEPRKIGWKERWHFSRPGFQVIRLATDKGDVEVAAAPDSLRRILDAIRRGDETS